MGSFPASRGETPRDRASSSIPSVPPRASSVNMSSGSVFPKSTSIRNFLPGNGFAKTAPLADRSHRSLDRHGPIAVDDGARCRDRQPVTPLAGENAHAGEKSVRQVDGPRVVMA